MEHNIMLSCADGTVRVFRVYGRARPRVGEVVTLPIDGKPTKVRIDNINDAEILGSVDHVNAVEMETA